METRLVHFASILKMATGFRVTKERVIKSTFDVKKKKIIKNTQLLQQLVHKKRVSIKFLIITQASKGVLIEFCQWTYFVCK